jgi:hypothetical protein
VVYGECFWVATAVWVDGGNRVVDWLSADEAGRVVAGGFGADFFGELLEAGASSSRMGGVSTRRGWGWLGWVHRVQLC